VDTGATSSFINPELIEEHNQQTLNTPILITTALGSHKVNKIAKIKLFTKHNCNDTFPLLLFKFHNYFDGLIGMNTLNKILGVIDIPSKILSTPKFNFELLQQVKQKAELFNIEEASKILVMLPVTIKEGTFLFEDQKVSGNLFITGGLYTAHNYYSCMEVVNYSKKQEKLYLETPIEVNHFNTDEFYIVNDIKDYGTINSEKEKEKFSTLRLELLNSEETTAFKKLCKQFPNIFYKEGDKLTFTNRVKHSIKTTDEIPVHKRPFRYSPAEKTEITDQINKLLEQDIIRHSHSPWSAPVFLVPKKLDASNKKKWRLVVDFRQLNDKTIKDRYPMPNINEILDKLGRAQYFSALDLASGYHQIEVEPKDRSKTAFSAVGGHFEFIRMPFGLSNAPATFQRVMDNVLAEFNGKFCLIYLDDIIVFSTSLQEHINHLSSIFKKLTLANLKLQPDKSEFLKKELEYLGHIVTEKGVKPNPKKIETIKAFPMPKTRKEIKSFLGLLGYYRRFIRDFAKITKPLTQQLKGKSDVTIDDNYIKTFEFCKTLLCNDPILQYPDFTKSFILTTDASNVAIGAVLSQGTVGNDRPIAYASRTLSESETHYATIKKELLAIVWAVKYFRPYLFGNKFLLVTDHKPLVWLKNLKEPNSMLVRWKLQLLEYDCEVIYKKGSQNVVADALSRIVVELNTNEARPITSDTEILTSNRPINEFAIQIILKIADCANDLLETPFKNKLRRIISRPLFDDQTMIDVLKTALRSNKTHAIYTTDTIFESVQKIYAAFFAPSKSYKIIRCTTYLDELRTPEEQVEYISDYHIKNNHRGIDETVSHIKRQIYFPCLKERVSQLINKCDICQTLKYDRQPQKPIFQLTETPNKPLDIVHIDLYSINNKTILTIIDKFSKFAEGYTIPSRDSINITKHMMFFFKTHGIPKTIVCDQGPEFAGIIFKELCNQYNITLHVTSFQQSSSNAPVERLHSSLTEIYRIIFEKKKALKLNLDHDCILTETFITYNNAIHSSTKLTPYEVFTGRTHIFEQNYKAVSQQDYMRELESYKNNLYVEVKEEFERQKLNKILKLNEDRVLPIAVQEGDTVFRKENRRNKLTPRFTQHKVADDNGVTFTTNKRQKIHKSKIKKRIRQNSR